MARKKRVVPRVRTLTTVTFLLGREECAVPITDVHQIIRDVPITRVPNVDPHVEGVINLRGVVIPVIDIKHRLGLGVRALGPSHRLLIADLGGRLVGFSVDAVTGILDFEETQIQSPPEVVLARLDANLVKGVMPREGKLVLLLDTLEIPKVKGRSLGPQRGVTVAADPPSRGPRF